MATNHYIKHLNSLQMKKKLEEAIKRVRVFIETPNRTALTGLLLYESLELLADTVESQLEEVK